MNECEWLPSVRGCLMADPMDNASSPSGTRRENSLKRNVKKEEKFWKSVC